jgi:class I fructose-bisphosphate aldolase
MVEAFWTPGTSLRASRLFDQRSKRGVIVAMDHGFGGAHKGLENPGETIARVMAGEPDGILVTPGTARRFQSVFAGRSAPAMIVSIDYVLFHPYPGSPDQVEEQGLASSVEEALRLGADAIKVLMIHGREDPTMQARNFDAIGRIADQCHQWGMPLMIEPTTWGHRFHRDKEAQKDMKTLRDMARIAFEFGADIVKNDYPRNPEDFDQIAESCPVPVLVLGGAKTDDEEALLRDVTTLVQHGAAGVTFGRNVWQYPEPDRIVRALRYCVHDEDVEAGLNELRGGEEAS